jgi:hypothetical protein
MFAEDLLAKTNAVLVLSPDAGGAVTYIADFLRVDPPASAIDQEPFALTFNHAASSASGYFVHHGSWPGRTVYAESAFFDAVAGSSIEHY